MDTASATRVATAASPTNPPSPSNGVPYVVIATVLPPCEVTILVPDTLISPVGSFMVFLIGLPLRSTITLPVLSFSNSVGEILSRVCSEKLIENVASSPCIITPDFISSSPILTFISSAAFMKAS